MITLWGKVLYLATLDFVLRSFFFFSYFSSTVEIVLIVVMGIFMLLFVMMIFAFEKIYKICVPSNNVPWASMTCYSIYFEVLSRIINPCVVALDHDGVYIVVEMIFCLMVAVAHLITGITINFHFSKKVMAISKIKTVLVSLILLIGVVQLVFSWDLDI